MCVAPLYGQGDDSALLPPTDLPKQVVEIPNGLTIDGLNDRVRLDRGDRLSYRIIEEKLPAVQITVNDAGEIDVPLIGHIRAVGKTCKQLAEEIKPLLEKEFYYKATVIIGLETHSERSVGKVYVMGKVNLPGGIEIPSGEMLTLSKAITRAQGFADFADRTNVRLTRRNNETGKAETNSYNVEDIVEKGLLDKDPMVLPNDNIYVPEIKRFHTKIYVLGKVNQPCSIDLQENEEMNVSKAIARAQGFAEFADKERVRLLRKNAIIPWFVIEDFSNPLTMASRILCSPDPMYKHLKALFEPEALDTLANPKCSDRQRGITLVGQFNRVIDTDTFFDEVLFANVKLTADTRRLVAQNPKGNDMIRMNRYLLEDFFRGEIRRNRPPEYVTIVVNVEEVISKGALEKDPVVLPNDTIVVPDSKRTHSKVSVMGQIRYPQSIDMPPGGNFTVSQAIAKAGGFVEFANKRKVKLLRRTPAEAYLFVRDDFIDARRLGKRLRYDQEPICAFLWNNITVVTRRAIVNTGTPEIELKAYLAKDFNRLLQNGLIYTEQRFAGVRLPLEVQGAVSNQTGACLFTVGDFLDVNTFIEKLSRHNDPFYTYLWLQFTPEERQIIANAVESTRSNDAFLMDTLLSRMNAILRGGPLYSPEPFRKVDISPEVLYLLAQNPQGEDLVMLNRELLEDACPLDLKRVNHNSRDKTIIQTNRRLLETAFPREIKRHQEYQSIIVDMQRIIDKAELDKDPLIEPDDLIMVPESWINF
ncbi:MAG: SLBB domain-containing protein [Chthoniobacteraceae bacterium]